MKGKGFLDGEEAETYAVMINAKDGIKFKSANGTVELYVFDVDKLSEEARKTIDDIKDDGVFGMAGMGDITASAFRSPFLMLCEGSADKDALVKAFNEYK